MLLQDLSPNKIKTVISNFQDINNSFDHANIYMNLLVLKQLEELLITLARFLLTILFVAVVYLALSDSHKMIKFLLIVCFHGTENLQSIFLFLRSFHNI